MLSSGASFVDEVGDHVGEVSPDLFCLWERVDCLFGILEFHIEQRNEFISDRHQEQQDLFLATPHHHGVALVERQFLLLHYLQVFFVSGGIA